MALEISINLDVGPNADDFAALLEDVELLKELVPEWNSLEAEAILDRIEERAKRLKVWSEKQER